MTVRAASSLRPSLLRPSLLRPGGGDGLLFREGTQAMFDVVETRTYSSGVVLLSYRLGPEAAGS